jgi:serine/threonine protein kinase
LTGHAAVTDDAGGTPRPGELAAAVSAQPGRELGSGYQASVRLYATPYGELVVKRAHGGPLGPLWRHLLRREHAVYERLGGIAGIPRAFGLVDGEALALEYVAGPSLREQDARLEDRERFFARLLATIEAMHAAGVAHGDLKRKQNVIVAAGEQPYLIDFGIACRRRAAAGLWNRWVFETFRQMDLNAWLKLKYGRRVDPKAEPGVLSAADAALYRPLLIERLARAVRVPWQFITLRRPRQRWRARRESRPDR